MKFTEQVNKRNTNDNQVVNLSIRDRLAAVCDQLDRLYDNLKLVEKRLIELQNEGITDANIHWREPGMLELLYPAGSDYVTRTGRRREYIGKDKTRQEQAIARVKRREECDQARKQADKISYDIQNALGKISLLEWAAMGKQKTFGDDWGFLASSQRPQENE
jgi:hypothetical protein